MSAPLEKTFQFLARTENEAAVEVLIGGLDCCCPASRYGALRALMDRRSPKGHDEVFRRLAGLDAEGRQIVEERPDRLARVAADVLVPSDDDCQTGKRRGKARTRNRQAHRRGARSVQGHRIACDAILSLRLYDALPALLAAVGSHETPEARIAAQTVLELTELFYAELASDSPKRRDTEAVRHRITDGLQGAVGSYRRHGCKELVEAFLLVVRQQNAVLRRILQRPGEGSHEAVVDVLSRSLRGGVIRLLLGFLEDPQSPQSVLRVISERTDARFVENLLHVVGPQPSRAIEETLLRLKSVAWAQPGHELFAELDGEAQRGAVTLLCASSVDRAQVVEVLGFLLLEGKPQGRRAAAAALAAFQGPRADALALQGLNDEDAEVRASLIGQLRPRGIPGAMSWLIRLIDSPHDAIRRALREALPEFTFLKFLDNFDALAEPLRPAAGHLVRRIDAHALPLLAKEMESLSPVRRRRAVAVAGAMGAVEEMEQTVIKLLSDDDHMVRIAAAKALADCKTMPTWEALRDALLDRSVVVREAAESSLQLICRSLDEPGVEEAEEVAR